MRFELPRKVLETGRLRFEHDAETRFREDHFKKSLRIVRAALLLALFLYASFGILDNWIVPDSKGQIWWIRYAMVCPFLAGVFALTYLPISGWPCNRMESHGVVDEIQVSQSTRELIRNEFECEPRGAIELKGIGPMTAYLLRGRSGEADPVAMPDKILDDSEGPQLGIGS